MEKINETNRLVVEFASIFGDTQHYPLSKTSQVWLVCESTGSDKTPVWTSITGIDQLYSQVGQLCFQWHAVQAEFGERLVNGKRVGAEAYLGVWREAAAKPISVQQLTAMGIGMQISISKSLPGFMAEMQAAMEKGSTRTDFQALLDSPFLSERTDAALTWSIPVTSLENCLVYCRVKEVWLDSRQFPAPVPERFDVLVAQEVHGAAAVIAPRGYETFDLFAMQEVSA